MKITPWNALLFEKTIKHYQFSISRIMDLFKTRVMTRRNVRKQWVGFPVIFSWLRWPIEPKFSQVCYFLYKLWYTICGPLENTVYRKCPMALISTLSLIEDTVPDVQSSKRAQNRCTNYCTVWGIVIVPRLYSKGTASSNWHRGKIFLCLSMKCTKLCLHVPE